MDVYGQPIGPQGYDIIESPIFLCWMPVLRVTGRIVRHPFSHGYKVHVSVAPGDADRVARAALPQLQAMRLDHKVVYPLSAYTAMNAGDQKGKFITIYPGPVLEGFTTLIGALDPLLADMGAQPGPQTMDRQSGHAFPERRIGRSGLLYYVTVTSYGH
jgi:hypothetical protein